NVVWDRPAYFRNDARPETPFSGCDVHRHDDRRWPADRHRRGEIGRAEVEAIVKPHHVLDRVYSHAAFADFPKDAVRVAVDSVKGWAVERCAEPMGSLMPR